LTLKGGVKGKDRRKAGGNNANIRETGKKMKVLSGNRLVLINRRKDEDWEGKPVR